jgi:hypothetical protein
MKMAMIKVKTSNLHEEPTAGTPRRLRSRKAATALTVVDFSGVTTLEADVQHLHVVRAKASIINTWALQSRRPDEPPTAWT